jgi:hypothetical protein
MIAIQWHLAVDNERNLFMSQPSPQQQLGQMITGYWISQAIYVAAKLGIADLLKAGPKSADELAKVSGSQAKPLYRLLRALASIGIFVENCQRCFALTPLAECLRSDVPGSQRALAITAGEHHYHAWGELLYSVRTSKTGFDKVYGMPIFDYLSQHPEEAKAFDDTMVSVHGRETQAMLDAYDFAGIQILADLGGGNGSLLTAVLRKYPKMRGILYDLPGVATRAKANIEAAGLADRCQVIGGSFFESAPGGADAYLMRHIIHDWNDEQCVRILRNIHRAMGNDGTLLLVESVIPPGNEPFFGKLLDLTMLVIPGGQERTQEEYAALYQTAGYQLKRIVPTQAEVSVIEGRKV